MSGRNAKISSSRFGDIRFPKHDKSPNSEVEVYHLTKDEIRDRYGSGPGDILTKAKFEELSSKKFSLMQMAEELKIPYQAVKYLASKYKKQMEVDPVETPVIREKEIFDQSGTVPKTRENYIMLKSKGLLDKEIAERFGMNKTNLPTLKKKWGLIDQNDSNHELVDLVEENNHNQVIEQLEEQIKHLQDKMNPIQISNATLVKQNKDLEQQLESTINEKNQLLQRLQLQQESSSKLYKESIQAIEKFDQTSKELHEAKNFIEHLRTDKEKLENRVRELLHQYQVNQVKQEDHHMNDIFHQNSYLIELEEMNRSLRNTLKLVL